MALYRQLKFPSTFIEYRSVSEWKGVVVISNFDSLEAAPFKSTALGSCLVCLGLNSPLGRVQLKCDGIRWRAGGEVRRKLANGVGSQYSSHYLGTWCIQHYYRWCAHLGCQQSTELTSPRLFKWTRPFRRKTKYGFCACAVIFQMQCSVRSCP